MGHQETEVRPLIWEGDRLRLLDQSLLPGDEIYIDCTEPEQVADAIVQMRVRGAPAIGIAAAYALALCARAGVALGPPVQSERLGQCARLLAATRPTAVNLFWAIERMQVQMAGGPYNPQVLAERMAQEAVRIEHEEVAACHRIGELGAALLPEGARVLTHCNAGALATGGYGTALGVIRAGWAAGKVAQVWADETRPLLQGARLTMWELMKEGIPATLIVDAAAGLVMARGLVDAVLVGADRIASNGDTANKIGTYPVAVLAHRHGIPCYVAAPTSTVDVRLEAGGEIPIEERNPEEVTAPAGVNSAPEGAAAFNPAFDLTPGTLVSAIITERGVARPPYREAWAALGLALPPERPERMASR